jgi:Berberine and berberine like
VGNGEPGCGVRVRTGLRVVNNVPLLKCRMIDGENECRGVERSQRQPSALTSPFRPHQVFMLIDETFPAPGSYVAESNFFNANWQQAFWGSNCNRLLAVKDQYDPGGLFFVHHGVGSERWSADGFTKLV